MKKLITVIGSLTLLVVMALSALAQNPAPAKTAEKVKAAKPARAAAAPKSDADVQKCINDKFAASKSVKNGSAAVNAGVAVLTGEASSGGAKGGATGSAKACGAKSVTNNMTVAAKPAKPAKPAAAPKKP